MKWQDSPEFALNSQVEVCQPTAVPGLMRWEKGTVSRRTKEGYPIVRLSWTSLVITDRSDIRTSTTES